MGQTREKILKENTRNYRVLALSNTFFSFISDMGLFNTDVLNREYNDFIKNKLPAVIACNY